MPTQTHTHLYLPTHQPTHPRTQTSTYSPTHPLTHTRARTHTGVGAGAGAGALAHVHAHAHTYPYEVATISRLLKIIGLFCKRALEKKLYSAKETSNFKVPTNHSHSMCTLMHMHLRNAAGVAIPLPHTDITHFGGHPIDEPCRQHCQLRVHVAKRQDSRATVG